MSDTPSHSRVSRILTQKLFIWVMCTLGLVSVLLLVLSQTWPHNNTLSDLLKNVGLLVLGLVIGSVIQSSVLREFFEQQFRDAIAPPLSDVQGQIVREFQDALPKLREATTIPIEDIRRRVSEASDFMLNHVDVLSGAKATGIVNIHPTRHQALSVDRETGVRVMHKDLSSETSLLRLMGISLGDCFLERGQLHKPLLEALSAAKASNRGADKPLVRALIVHPRCEALRERARWEAGPECYEEPAFFASTTFIETDGSAKIAKRLSESYRGLLQVRTYRQAPTAFLALTSRFVFIESYSYASRGSEAPVFQVQAGSPLYRSSESHFERIWEIAEPIENYPHSAHHNKHHKGT